MSRYPDRVPVISHNAAPPSATFSLHPRLSASPPPTPQGACDYLAPCVAKWAREDLIDPLDLAPVIARELSACGSIPRVLCQRDAPLPAAVVTRILAAYPGGLPMSDAAALLASHAGAAPAIAAKIVVRSDDDLRAMLRTVPSCAAVDGLALKHLQLQPRRHAMDGGRGEQGTWAAQKHSEAGYGRPVDAGVWTAKTVKRPRQQPAHPQYANYWAPLTRKRHTMPHSAQSQHTNDWAPRTRKQHQQEHRPQRPTERSDPTQHAKGRPGDCPGPRKGATTGRNDTQGAHTVLWCSMQTKCGLHGAA